MLKVLQYNTHLFEGTIAAVKKHTTLADDARLGLIAEKIAADGYDVVTLEEFWSRGSQEAFYNALAGHGYIYQYADDSGPFS